VKFWDKRTEMCDLKTNHTVNGPIKKLCDFQLGQILLLVYFYLAMHYFWCKRGNEAGGCFTGYSKTQEHSNL